MLEARRVVHDRLLGNTPSLLGLSKDAPGSSLRMRTMRLRWTFYIVFVFEYQSCLKLFLRARLI